ncbi:MAG: hypothetical protein WCQ50_12605 [Spirochaetota bacterium]
MATGTELTLSERGTRGFASAGAGIGLIGINALISIPVVGWAIGGGLAVLGLLGMGGKTKTDKTYGTISLVAGAAVLLAQLHIGPLGFILGAGGLGLLAYGGWNIFKFARGMKDRS